jgi:DNA-directed RNA polymerase specialized sigma24 family protein
LDAPGIDAEALYRRERDRVFAVCYAILREPHDAEDAVQDTFARVAG